MADATCSACSTPITWIRMLSTGKPMPIDAEPVEDGNVAVSEGHGRVIKKEQRAEYRLAGVPLFKSHFATCSAAAQFRRPRRG